MRNIGMLKRFLVVFVILLLAGLMIRIGFHEVQNSQPSTPLTSDVANVALIIMDKESAQRVPLLIKNIRSVSNVLKTKISLHVVCHHKFCQSLRVLFSTWRVHRLDTTFYDITQLPARVKLYGLPLRDDNLYKYFLHEILHSDVERVLLLDVNVLVSGDVKELLKITASVPHHALFALAKNQRQNVIAPYDTSVMSLNLAGMRDSSWTESMQTFLQDAPFDNEEEFLNRVHREVSQIFTKLPCEWNIQLDDDSSLASCIPSETSSEGFVKLMSWKPSLTKHSDFPNTLLKVLRGKYLDIEIKTATMDGNILREPDAPSHNKIDCFEERQEQRIERRIHPFFYGSAEDSHEGVSLVIQGSLDRFGRLPSILERWGGPISLAIYLRDEEVPKLQHFTNSITGPLDKTNLNIHLVYKEGRYYPTNALRNVAMDYATTSHVFVMDADFIPSRDCYDNLMKQLLDKDGLWNTAYVVPAFETFDSNVTLPYSKTELIEQVKRGKIEAARLKKWPPGHLPTDFDRWYKSDEAYVIPWAAEFEPYVLVARNAGRFDNRFVGFGWDKVAFYLLLTAKKFTFVVLPNPFVVHYPHVATEEKVIFNTGGSLTRCINKFKKEYIHEIAESYGKIWNNYPNFRSSFKKRLCFFC